MFWDNHNFYQPPLSEMEPEKELRDGFEKQDYTRTNRINRNVSPPILVADPSPRDIYQG